LSKEKIKDEMSEFDAESALEIGEEEGIELIPETTIERKMDSIDEMSAEELKEYLSGYAYYYYDKNVNIIDIIEKELDYYFPQYKKWDWIESMVIREGNDYILQLQDFSYLHNFRPEYEAQFRIRPDFTVELIEDSIKAGKKEIELCVYKTDREYIYHGGKIVEYYGERYHREHNVIDANGKTIGRYYYEIPEIRTPTFGALWIIKKMKEDRGRFFNELAKEFEEVLFYLDEEIEYAISWDFWEMGIQNSYMGSYCYVDCEVICNNGEIFGVKYHYRLWLDKVGCKGEAVAIYNTNEEVVEYEDWQSTVLEEIRNTTFEKKQGD